MSLKYRIRREGEHEKNSNKEKENFFIKILCDESHKNTFLQFFSKKSENPIQSYLSNK